jgi:hypothetical protein
LHDGGPSWHDGASVHFLVRVAVFAFVTLAITAGGPSSAWVKVSNPATGRHGIAPVQPDPPVGPHTAHDTRHASDILTFTPATGSEPVLSMSSSRFGMSAGMVTAVAPSQRREVFGFAPYWLLSHYSEWDYSVLSTIAYFGLNVNADGSFATFGGGWNGWNSIDLINMINLAHRAGDRVVLVIKTSDDGTINTVTTTAIRQTLVNNVISAIQAKGLDGVNVDFEGTESSLFPDLQAGITALMTDLSSQVHAKWPQAEVSIDTYAGSASWDGGIFKIGDLAPVVDAMFIMAYDSVFSNMPGQAGPNSPLNGWTYNDTIDVQQYLSKAPASKILLGVPYYGYRWSTTSGGPYATIVGNQIAEGYSAAMDDLACPHPALRTGWDGVGASPWASWWSPANNDPCGDNFGRPQELYYDNSTSLGLKYDLVNNNNLRGTGMWALGMDSGRMELWSTLHTYFSCPVSINVSSAPTTTEFNIGLTSGTCTVAYYDLQQYDTTTNQGWFTLPRVTPAGGAADQLVEGYPGHTYQFQARAHTTAGLVSSWTSVTTSVAANATYVHPFKGLYTVDSYGGVNADSSPPLGTSATWPGWKIARAAKAQPGANTPQSGFVLDGWGGLHPYGAGLSETSGASGHYWPGWDIARDFAFLPDGSGGFVLDGWGGLHPFRVNANTAALSAQTTGYWPGWDIARKVVIFQDGSGGYVMDAWGGLHPFGINGPSPVSSIVQSGYWPGWNIARDVVVVSGHSGYTLDGWGGLHEFHAKGDPALGTISASGYWAGWDIARGVWFLPGSATAGYTLDGWGGLHPFGGAPALTSYAYWPGTDMAIAVAGG